MKHEFNETDGSALANSFHSSDGPASCGGVEDICIDERIRIERKMEMIKEKISRINLAREAVVDDFLKVTSTMERKSENAQLARVRQHFEKRNKKSAQDIEHLQKKLEQLKIRQLELDRGVIVEPSTKAAMLNNIRKTGPLLKEVMSAPRGFAHMIKNTFGSADNIPDTLFGGSNIGQSTFYSDTSKNERATIPRRNVSDSDANNSPGRYHKRTETLPAMSFDLNTLKNASPVGSQHAAHVTFSTDENDIGVLRNELNEFKAKVQILLEQLNKLQNQNMSEYNYFNNALHEERIKIQRLEGMLNETIELHQAEMIALKSDLNTIATRMDYQYSDRFRSIEESIEGTQNKAMMIRMEANVKEWAESRPQASFSSVMLSGANILVEFLKLILFIVSFVLDFVKPFTETRTRAGFVILIWIIIMIIPHFIDLKELFTTVFNRTNLTAPS